LWYLSTGLRAWKNLFFGVSRMFIQRGTWLRQLLALTGNYAHITAVGKIALSLAMLLGRLEIFTALALLRSDYWKSTKTLVKDRHSKFS